MEHERDGDTNWNWCTLNNPQRIDKGNRQLRNQRKSRDYPDYSILEIGQKAEKKPGDMRRLAFTQNPVKKHHLALVRKILKKVK